MELRGLLGIAVLLVLAWLLSENRKRVYSRTILVGTALQFVFALLRLKVPLFKSAFLRRNDLAQTLENARRSSPSA